LKSSANKARFCQAFTDIVDFVIDQAFAPENKVTAAAATTAAGRKP
jgi:hypothetical protein